MLASTPPGVVVYTSSAAYTAAVGPQGTEGFDGGKVTSSGLIACDLTESSTSDDQCFAPGALMAGVTYEVPGPHPSVLVGPDYPGLAMAQPSAFLAGPGTAGITMAFSTPQTSVGFDVVDPTDTVGQTCTVTLAGAAAATIGTITEPCGDSQSFIGFTSAVPVSTVTVSDGDTGATGIDDVAFGVPTGLPGSSPTAGLPEAPLAIGVPLAAAAVGALVLRRRRRRTHS